MQLLVARRILIGLYMLFAITLAYQSVFCPAILIPNTHTLAFSLDQRGYVQCSRVVSEEGSGLLSADVIIGKNIQMMHRLSWST